MCKDIYLWQMELTTTEPQDNAILTLEEDLAKWQATAELITKTYAKPSSNDNSKPPTKKKPKFKKTTPQLSDRGQDKKLASGQKGDLPGNHNSGGNSGSPSKHKKFFKNNDSKSAGDKGNGPEKEHQ
ncbi:hypothetical protein BG006_003739 [Podila minutissima]|uniref:Uncharacterized protein n=1 Tax=Podila minutissima TaxID=64525 RepID=A0A9P5SAV1_9FUNG|nr:hypothetical protein BG006_003739 [Podila minutissima]